MHNDLFSIGPFTIHTYGLLIALGILAAIAMGTYRVKKRGLETTAVMDIAVYGLIGGFVGAKLLFIITELGNIIKDPSILLDIGNGFVVYGGIAGGVLAAYLYCRIKKLDFLIYFDLLIPAVPLAQGIGRIGCFMAGCCYGRPTDAWYGVTFPTMPFVSVIPTQLISSAGDFLIMGLLLLMSHHQRFKGQIAAGYMVLYGVGRFLIEFLRDDPRGWVGLLSTSQFISIFIVALGLILAAIWKNANKPLA